MACCDDPTEPKKLDRREVIRLQEQYGELVRDLLTQDPENVILKLVNNTNTYLTELAALNAHHASVRLKAIGLLETPSLALLQRIAEREKNTPIGLAAQNRIEFLCRDQ